MMQQMEYWNSVGYTDTYEITGMIKEIVTNIYLDESTKYSLQLIILYTFFLNQKIWRIKVKRGNFQKKKKNQIFTLN